MKPKQRTLLYGQQAECLRIIELLRTMGDLMKGESEYTCVDNWDALQTHLVDWNPDLAIMLADGAAGMEGVYLARDSRPGMPVIWFTDDRDFALQSYRMNCDYFAVKPITEEKMRKILRRCFG